jgi:alpha-galactosidase
MKNFPSLLTIVAAVLFGSLSSCSTTPVITHDALRIEVNDSMQTRISANFDGASPLMNDFSTSESLITSQFQTGAFTLNKKEKIAVDDHAGKGTAWMFTGTDQAHGLQKILRIKTYDSFPDVAYLDVRYVNIGDQPLSVTGWINSRYKVIPSEDTTKFWSFQGSSHEDRRDWIQRVNPGFHQENYMGMNASDYGGGIPVVDLWRKDVGLAIGHTEPVAKLVSLPIEYAKDAQEATLDIEYHYPRAKSLAAGDTLQTFHTFVSVHQKDCFATLKQFAAYMQTKGIKPAPSEPAAFEPIWCAWGYGRNFTVKEILNTLPKVKELGIHWVGIDDGYQQAEGDWNTNRQKFPEGDIGMKTLVDSIHAAGMKAVLWWAPLAVDSGTKFLKENPNVLLIQENGKPQHISWWDSYYMAPTDSAALRSAKSTVEMFMKDWGFDALKLDGQHMNAVAPDYASGHGLQYPEQSYEALPKYFQTIFETARSIHPNAVVEFCPCGDCMNFYTMPYTNQFVASDPTSSWQVRLKGKVYKAMMPQTAYFGDHVELTDNGDDFASQIGIGAVPGTKFIWPATGNKRVDRELLTPERESLFKKWISLYQDKMLSTGTYRGGLYDIGYDIPEAHCIEKDGEMYYAFYNPDYNGEIALRGLDKDKRYTVTDYFHGKSLGEISGEDPHIQTSFQGSLMLEVKEIQ